PRSVVSQAPSAVRRNLRDTSNLLAAHCRETAPGRVGAVSSPVGILLQTLQRVVDRVSADGSTEPVALDVRTASTALHLTNLGEPRATAALPARLRLGSWIGGDQDGNPHCTAADLQAALRGAEAIARARHRDFALRAVDELTLPLTVDDLEPRTRRWLRIHAG